MKTENSVLMQRARESLAGKWGLAIGTCVVYMLIVVGIQMIPKAGPFIVLIIGGPMMLGLIIFSLKLARAQEAKLEDIFSGFNRFGTALGTHLLVILFTLLWMLLLIVPGIIAAFSYSMAFYILADDNSIGAMDAIDKSKKMMYGYKWKYFCLTFRFLGWALLCVLTLGIGFLWFMPYVTISFAKFYDDIKENSVPPETLQPR